MTHTTATQLSAIGQIAMTVHDLPPAIECYRDRLGMCFLFQAPPAKMPDHELWMAFFKDSEGNTLALMEERRPKP